MQGGFDIRTFQNGLEAAEYIVQDVPDVVVVSLKLSDVAGDIVINRLFLIALSSENLEKMTDTPGVGAKITFTHS